MKHSKRGRPPAIKHPGYHTVYLDRETWRRLMKYKGGASKAIRDQETRIIHLNGMLEAVRAMLVAGYSQADVLAFIWRAHD